ncbi:MAG: hypothetical protein GPJ54_08815 [Candidatus Heimdallarchaeota archaeon]|nr:hypothetical protein [Candidatus Heimdallarchaeota archaeon]
MKRITLSLGLIAVMVLGVQLSFNSTSFPGFHGGSQCGICHNEPAIAWNSSLADLDLTLDGNGTEAFWDDNDDHLMYIPLGTTFGFPAGEEQFVRFMVGQNSTHFFMYARIADLTINGSDTRTADADAFAVMFNIDMPEFKLPSAAPAFGPDPTASWSPMSEALGDGGTNDVVMWQPSAAADDTQGTYDPAIDDGDGGFTSQYSVDGNVWDLNYGGTFNENQDWSAEATHGYIGAHYTGDYAIEFSRALVTDDANDAQFKYDGYYEFAIAYWNASSGSQHWVSFEHTIWIHGADGAEPLDTITETVTEDAVTVTADPVTETKTEDAPFNSLLSFFGLITISLAVMVYRKRD